MKKGFLLEKKIRKVDTRDPEIKQRIAVPSEQCSIIHDVKEKHVSKTDGNNSGSTRTNGWKKGFLNKSNRIVHTKGFKTNTKAGPVANNKLSSSELLELENDQRGNTSWTNILLKTNTHSTQKSPLIMVQDDETEEIKSHDRSELQTINPITNVVTSMDHEEQTPIIRELSSRILCKSDDKVIDANVETYGQHDKESVPQHDPVDESCLPLPSQSLPTKFSILLSKLERLYKRKRRKLKLKIDDNIEEELEEEKSCLDAFFKEFIRVQNNEMSKQSQSNIMFVFDNIFTIIPSYSKSQIQYNWDKICDHILPPCLVLGLAIFDSSELEVCQSLVTFWSRTIESMDSENLHDDHLKREKVKLIGSFICIKVKICSWHASKLQDLSMNAEQGKYHLSNLEMDPVYVLLKSGIPSLSDLLNSSHIDGKRTILAVHALETAFVIIEDACLSYTMCHDLTKTSMSLTIEDLLQVKTFLRFQEKWWLEDLETDKNLDRGHSKRLCHKGILADWKLVVKAAEVHFNRSVCDNKIDENTSHSISIYRLSKMLSGVYLDRGTKENVSRSYGGIAQTMCKDIRIANSDSEHYLSFSLQLVSTYIHDLQETNDSEIIETAILRSICFWMIQKFNSVDWNRIQSECLQTLIGTLKSKQKRSIDLTTAIIYTLWSVCTPAHSGSDENEESDHMKLVDGSLRTLIDELNLSSNEVDVLSETEIVKCILCARIILDGKGDFLRYFLRVSCLNPFKIYVIFILLDSEELSVEDRAHLEEKLLTYLPNSEYLQRRVHSEVIMFTSIPTQKLIESMFNIFQQENSSSYLVSVASLTLSKMIISRVSLHHNEVIEAFVSILSKARDHQNVFNKYVRSWRRNLFSDSCSSSAYQCVIESCARAMFRDPSNEVILNILGGFVGSSQDFINVDDSIRNHIRMGTEGVLLIASNELHRLNMSNSSDVFARLSPLLLLRRIPHEHYLLCINDNVLSDLGMALSYRLGISTQSANVPQDTTTSEERRLLAEVAARCIPFSSQMSKSCKSTGFSVFCEEVIFSTLSLISRSQIVQLKWNNIKIVIYIGCHLLQISPKSFGNYEMSTFIIFTLILLNLNVSVEHECYKFITEVQSGCIDFLATCICVPYLVPLSLQKQNQHSLRHELVVEIDKNATSDFDKNANMLDIYVKGLQTHMLKLIRRESTEYLTTFMNDFKNLVPNDTYVIARRLLVGHEWKESRVDLLNAFVIASQGCPQEGILSFAYSGPMKELLSFLFSDCLSSNDDSVCTASALRFVFNLLQRRKFFDVLHPSEVESRALAIKLFDLSLRITKHPSSESDAVVLNVLRKEGLKLLMVIISIDQNDSGRKVVTTGNLFKAVSLLQELSNLDTDPDIRQFAQQLLTCVT